MEDMCTLTRVDLGTTNVQSSLNGRTDSPPNIEDMSVTGFCSPNHRCLG